MCDVYIKDEKGKDINVRIDKYGHILAIYDDLVKSLNINPDDYLDLLSFHDDLACVIQHGANGSDSIFYVNKKLEYPPQVKRKFELYKKGWKC